MEKIEPLPEVAQLLVVDSTLVIEKNQFFARPSEVTLIGDSLMAVSCFLTPGIWFIETKTGEIKYSIADGEIVDTPIFPAGFDVSEFPIIYILHPKLQTIQKFDVIQGELLNKVSLDFPTDKMVRTVESLFIKGKSFYYIELYPNEQNNSVPEFYKHDNGIIGVFDFEGKFIDSFLEYPEELTELKKSLMAYRSFVHSDSQKDQLIVFPSSRQIKKLDLENRTDEIIFSIPKKSRYFDFSLQILENTFDPNFDRLLDFPSSHFFNKIVKNENHIYLQSDMRDNGQLGHYNYLTNIFWIDQRNSILYETQPFDPNQLGLLAGANADTLYFFEGSLKRTEEKYIKRAVLRPIDH